MATQPTAPPVIAELPPAPNSSTDTPSEFDVKANNTVAAQVIMVPQINTSNDWVEQTAQEVYDNAVEAENSAVNSAQSATESESYKDIAQQAANLLGNWSALTGTASLGDVVLHINGRWQATTAIADIPASEPSLSNSDWVLINYNGKSFPIADGVTLSAIAINEISATQSNPLPLAASVPVNTMLKITVPETYKGITTTHLASGSDTTTDSNGTLPNGGDPVAGFIFNWPSGGTLFVTSNGIDNWRY